MKLRVAEYVRIRNDLGKGRFVSVIDLASRIESDHYRANVFLVLAPRARDDATLREAYLEAAATINSDVEYQRAVRPLGDRG